MRLMLAVCMFMGLAGWVWVDAAASGAIDAPVKIEITLKK